MPLVTRADPILHTVARPVPKGERVDSIIDTMFDVMNNKGGIGLAANQIGILRRVIAIHIDGFRVAIVNPVITKAYGGLRNSKEGCLSFPGERVLKIRHQQVRVEGFDVDWEPIHFKLNGLRAFCVQHEVDHLNGITII